jgi:transcriptional regulator with XRE-family HTH domain
MAKQILTESQIDDARRLDRLWNERKPEGMTQEKFGLEYDMGTQGNVNLYLRGKSRLNLYAVGQFAKMLGVKIDEISPDLADQVRELYKNCDPNRNREFMIRDDPDTREYILHLIQEEANRRERLNTAPTSDNGQNS